MVKRYIHWFISVPYSLPERGKQIIIGKSTDEEGGEREREYFPLLRDHQIKEHFRKLFYIDHSCPIYLTLDAQYAGYLESVHKRYFVPIARAKIQGNSRDIKDFDSKNSFNGELTSARI